MPVYADVYCIVTSEMENTLSSIDTTNVFPEDPSAKINFDVS
jgi:hypothetical protein